LGGSWYSRRTEDRLLREVDAVVASASSLEHQLRSRSGRQVTLLPNAVNTRVFARGRRHERPRDLPQAEAVFTYVGALWGEWFDWDWVLALARANPRAAVVLLGDYRGQCRQPPPNLHFLGLRPQQDLPAYLAHSDVCLVPFKVDRLVEAVSPLKIFEYLAMGRPVVASDMPEVLGLPGVLVARDEAELLDAARRAQTLEPREEDLVRFVAENSWKARVRQLERLLGA
jgi:glycosyltransferase involved in cell wall biosynthesis